jgi:DNA-binding CsgD family transcriptional regulator
MARAAGERFVKAVLAPEARVGHGRWMEDAATKDARKGAAHRRPAETVEIVADCERLIELASRRFRDGDLRSSGEAVVRAGELARRAGRPDLLGEAALVVSGVDDDLLNAAIEEMAQEAIAGLGDGDISLQARLYGQLAVTHSHGGRLDEAAAASERALNLAERTQDAGAVAAALHARQMVVVGLGRPGELLELGARMLELGGIGEAAGNPLLGHVWRIDGFLQRGEAAAARREIDALDVLAARTGDPLVRWHALRARAGLDQAVGRLAQAERHARLAVEAVPPSGRMIARGLFYAQLVLISTDRGVQPAEIDEIRGSSAGAPPVVRAFVGRLELAIGDRMAALASLEATKPRLDSMPLDEPWLPTMAATAELAVGCDDVATAEALHHDLARFDGLMIAASIGAVGPVAQFLGLIEALTGRLDEAIAHFESAVALAGIGDLGPSLVRARLALAMSLERRGAPGDRDRARRLASVAAVDAARLDMRSVLLRANALVDGLVGSQARLSRREREIAGHVAAGLSNREIAELLVLSERTVETHTQHILTKLGFRARTQIAAWAAIDGLRDNGA